MLWRAPQESREWINLMNVLVLNCGSSGVKSLLIATDLEPVEIALQRIHATIQGAPPNA